MKINDFVEGIQILQKYYDDSNGFHLGADHDIIYLYSTDNPLSEEDVKRLHELGFFQEGYDNETGEYGPDDGWCAFT